MLFAACLLAAPSALAAPESGADGGFLRAVNAARASVGLQPVELDPTLARAARSHTLEMLQADEFSHSDFGRRMAAFNVRGSMMGENLAWGSGPYGAVGAIVREWLASPGHRANLLRPGYKRIGIGVARGTFQGYDGATIVTADFAG